MRRVSVPDSWLRRDAMGYGGSGVGHDERSSAAGVAGRGVGLKTGGAGGALVVTCVIALTDGAIAIWISGGGMNGGGGITSLGGGGGGASGGGGALCSSTSLVSIGFLITSTILRARPFTSA